MQMEDLQQTLVWLAVLVILIGMAWWMTRGRNMWLRRARPQAAPPDPPAAPTPEPAVSIPPVAVAPPVAAAPTAPAAVPPAPPAAPAVPYQHLDQRLREVEHLLGRLVHERTAATEPVPTAALRLEVALLQDEGLTVPEIARRLTLARGEVELLQALRRARPEA